MVTRRSVLRQAGLAGLGLAITDVRVFGFPSDLVLYRIVPGTALGVLVGDLWYTWLARRLARKTGRTDVTAMPFGIDTPSLFAVNCR